MAFLTTLERRAGGREVVSLHDDASGASASILPSFGFNLFDLRLPVKEKAEPILVASPTFADDPKGPARNGTPILFPFPNRIRDGQYRFGGASYDLPKTNGNNAIHGWAMSASWTLVAHGADADGAFAIGRYHLAEHSPEGRKLWPTDAVLEIRYSLAGRKLTMTATVSNPTDQDLPYGLGFHPYFRLPFAPGGDPAKTRVVVPASKYWVLDQFLPTGETKAVDSRLDFRSGQPREGLKLDDVLTDLAYEGAHGVCRLIDLEKRTEFRLGFDKHYRELVVYTPADGDVISLEPYTQTTDAINLQARGVDAGLRVLKHGDSDTMIVTMETADFAG
jgi:aldose 1-epimerase